MENKLKAFLIDIDGVLTLGDSKIEGADETLNYLDANNFKYELFTNITRMSKRMIIEKLKKAGIEMGEEKIVTPISASIDFIKSNKENAKCYLIMADEVEEDFKRAGIVTTRKEEPADFVVIGLDKRINYDMMNSGFRLLLEGAELVAMHEDRFYPKDNSLFISLGAFVRGLEYSSDKKAYIIGKPNKNFFETILNKIGSKKEETAVIGDSIAGDIGGGKKAGFKTILVRTGNFREADLEKSEIKPDFIIDSIKDLPKIIKPA